jgi:hypothetical protein
MIWGSLSGGYEKFYLLRYNAGLRRKSIQGSEEHVASIFRVDDRAKQETSVSQVASNVMLNCIQVVWPAEMTTCLR